MKTNVITHRAGRHGASFQLCLGDKIVPYKLSRNDMARLEGNIKRALDYHDALLLKLTREDDRRRD